MYQVPHETDDLRQGDILRGIELPIINHKEIVYAAFRALGAGDLTLAVEKGGRFPGILDFYRCDVMVVSQCCELKEGRRANICIAAIRDLTDDWHEPRNTESLALLRSCNRIVTDGSQVNAFAQYFYLQPLLPVVQEGFVDFTTITSIRYPGSSHLLPLKKSQLTNSARDDLRMKIAYFFARPDTPTPRNA